MQSREQKLAAAKRRLEKLKKARTASSAAGGQTPLEDPHSPNSEYRSGHDGSEVDHTDLQQTKIDPGQSSPFGKPPQLSLARGSSSSLSRLEVNTTVSRSQTFAMQQGSPMRSSSATESLRRLSVNSTSDVSGLSTDEVLAQNSVLRSQVTTLTAENASMLKKLKDLEQLAQGFRYEQAAVKSKYASFEQSIQELRSRLATKEVVIQQQQHERDSLKIKLAELEAAAVPRVEGEALMQKQIEDLPSKLENSKSESKGFFSDVSIREASALPDGAEAEIEALKNELAAAKLEAARGTERVQSLTTEVAFLSEAKQQLESEVEAAKSELTLLRNGTPGEPSDSSWEEIDQLRAQMLEVLEQSRQLQLEVQAEKSKSVNLEVLLEAARSAEARQGAFASASDSENWQSRYNALKADMESEIHDLQSRLSISEDARVLATESLKISEIRCETMQKERDEYMRKAESARSNLLDLFRQREALSSSAPHSNITELTVEELFFSLSNTYASDLAQLNEAKERSGSQDPDALRTELESDMKKLKDELHQKALLLSKMEEDTKRSVSVSTDLNQQIANLSAKLAALENDKAALEQAVTEANAAKTQLLASLSSASAEATVLKEKEGEVHHLSSELSRLRSTLGELIDENASLKSLQDKIVSDARDKLESLVQEKDELIAQKEQMREAGATVVESARRLEEENDALIAENETLVAEKDQLAAELQSTQGSKSALAEELAEVQAQNEKLREAGRAVVEVKVTLEKENEALSTEIATLREAGAAIVADRQRLQDLTETLEQELEDLAGKLEESETSRSAYELEIADLRNEIDRLRAALAEEAARSERLEASLREIESKSSGDIQDLVDSLRNLTEANADLKRDLKGANDKILAFSQEKESLRLSLESKSAEIEAFGLQIARSEELERSLEELQDQLEAAKEERNGLLETLNSVRRSESELNSDLQRCYEEISDLTARLAESEQRYATLCEDGEVHTSQLEESIRELRREKDEIDRKLIDLENEKADLVGQLQNIESRVSADIRNLETENEELTKRIRVMEEGAADDLAQINQYEDMLLEKDRYVEQLATDNQALAADKDSYEQQFIELQRELDAAKASEAELSARLRDFERLLEEARAHSSDLEIQVSELKKLEETFSEMQSSLERQRESAEQRSLSMQKEVAELKAQMVSLEGLRDGSLVEIEELSHQHRIASQELADCERRLGDLQSELDGLQRDVNASNEEVERLKRERGELLAQKQSMELTISDLTLSRDQFANVQYTLEQEARDASLRCEELERQIDTQSREAAVLESRLQEVESELVKYRHETSTLREKSMQSISAFEDARRRLNEVETEYDAARIEHERVKLDFDDSLQHVDRLQSELEDVKRANHDLSFEKNEALSKLEKKASAVKELEEKLSESWRLNDELRRDIDSAISERDILKGELARKQKDLESARLSSRDAGSERQSVTELKDRIKDLEESLKVKGETIDRLFRDLDEWKQRSSNLMDPEAIPFSSNVSSPFIREGYRSEDRRRSPSRGRTDKDNDEELRRATSKITELEEEIRRLRARSEELNSSSNSSMIDLYDAEATLSKAGATVSTLDQLLKATVNRVAEGSSGSQKPRSTNSTELLQLVNIVKVQVSTLTEVAEANLEVSAKVLKNMNGAGVETVLRMQTNLVEEHRKLLSTIENIHLVVREGGPMERLDQFGRRSARSASPYMDLGSLMSHFVASIKKYEGNVSNLIDTCSSMTARSAVSPSSVQEQLKEVATQHVLLSKQVGYLTSLVTRYTSGDQSDGIAGVNGSATRPSVSIASNGQNDTRDYQLSSAEYADLVTKAALADRFRQQLEDSAALQAEHSREVQVLKEAIEAMSYQLKEGSPATESKTNRLLQKQVDELKKVWSHELSANNILRNLIAKIQADSIYAEEEGRKQQIRLRQEFDELVALFDETNQDAVVLREDVSMRDRMLKDLEHRTDERLNAQFLDLEQQHQEQTQQLEEMYEKERTALNQLVLNLEKERDRLQAEFAAVKLSLGERLAEAIRSSESAFTRAREAERAREDADRELSMAREDIRMMEDAIAKLRSDASVREGVDRELKDIEIRFERRERNLIDELKHIERRLADREAELANERRLFDKRFGEREAFWIAETKARDQELIALRENAKMFGHERLEQTIRHLQADKDQLENSLYGKERQVQTLEVRVQELLQMEGDMIPLYEVRRREADLERGLQDQIRELQSQLTNSEEARRLMEAQFLFERDRSRKLTSKNDELKRKYIQQRHQLQQQDEAINSALRPGPRGGDEVHILRRELLQSRQFSSGIVNIIREALVNTMGEVSIDIEDSETRMVRVDILRVRDQVGALVAETVYLRALTSRLVQWRADLKYQKVYLSLKVEDLQASQKVYLTYIQKMGVSGPLPESDSQTTPIRKWKRCVDVVIAIWKMRKMARAWELILKESSTRDYFAATDTNQGNESDNWRSPAIKAGFGDRQQTDGRRYPSGHFDDSDYRTDDGPNYYDRQLPSQPMKRADRNASTRSDWEASDRHRRRPDHSSYLSPSGPNRLSRPTDIQWTVPDEPLGSPRRR